MNDKQTFQIENVKCGGCANTLKKALFEEFGEVEVNLEVIPREITLKIEENQIESLKSKLKTLGYPLSSDELNTIEKITTTAKSFVSCAIGKMDN
jgi:copper chaperone CopZ